MVALEALGVMEAIISYYQQVTLVVTGSPLAVMDIEASN